MSKEATGGKRMHARRSSCIAALALPLCTGYAGAALAQPYPAKPIRFIVGFGAGGGNDMIARTLSRKLTESMGQQGYEATSWQGVVVPSGTPRAIVNRLYSEIAKALQSPEVIERLAAEGSTPGGITPDAFAAHIQSEIAKWAKVVKMSGAKAD